MTSIQGNLDLSSLRKESAKDPMEDVTFDMKMEISEEVFKKVMYWIDKADFEVSGLGKVVIDKERNVIKVVDAILLKQENSACATELDAASVGKAMFLLKDSPGDLRWWFHSHVNFSVFWSGTDQGTIKTLGSNGWFTATVFNKKREMLSAFVQSSPVRIVLPNVETKIEQIIDPALTSKWDEEYAANVTEKSYSHMTYGPGSNLEELFAEYHKRWPDEDTEETKQAVDTEEHEEEKKEIELTDEQYQEYSDKFDVLYDMKEQGKLTDDEFDNAMRELNIKYGFDEDDTSELEDAVEADAMDLGSSDKEEVYEGFRTKYEKD
jgi:hypothetical protein